MGHFESKSATVPPGTSGVSLMPCPVGNPGIVLLGEGGGVDAWPFFFLHDFFASLFFNAFFLTTFCDFDSKKPPKIEPKSNPNQWNNYVGTHLEKKCLKMYLKGVQNGPKIQFWRYLCETWRKAIFGRPYNVFSIFCNFRAHWKMEKMLKISIKKKAAKTYATTYQNPSKNGAGSY